MAATDRFGLKSVTGELSDARFRQSNISFDQSARIWTLVCWSPRRGRSAVCTEWWQELRFTVSNVVTYKSSFTEKVDYYEIASLSLSEDKTQLQILCHYGADLRLTIGQLDVQLLQGSGEGKRGGRQKGSWVDS